MKLKDEFVTVLNGEDFVTVSTDTELFSGMIRGNETAAMIMKCLEKETDIEEITDKIFAEYDAERSLIRENVEEIVEKLRSIGAIDE